MSRIDYIKIYTGNGIIVQVIQQRLEAIGIVPIIKNETESARLAGYGASMISLSEIHVHEDELEKAVTIVEIVRTEMEIR